MVQISFATRKPPYTPLTPISQDYKAFLDFVLAMENIQTPEAIAYCFRLLDIKGQKYLDEFTVGYFFKVRQALMIRILNVVHDIFFAVEGGNGSDGSDRTRGGGCRGCYGLFADVTESREK